MKTNRMLTMPEAPQSASPVPWLTSLHSVTDRGPWGAAAYRGNCSGYLIKDLIQFYEPEHVLDPMAGGGTCKDVCESLGIACTSFDLSDGQDATNGLSYQEIEPVDFIWLHPPYWRMIGYSNDPRCLSNAPSILEFLEQIGTILALCRVVLKPTGHLAMLVGGYRDQGEGGNEMPLSALTTTRAIQEGFWPACTEIVRFQHGNTSSKKSYRSRLIPGLHDTCTVFKRSDLPDTMGLRAR